jgi:hypothetical protein
MSSTQRFITSIGQVVLGEGRVVLHRDEHRRHAVDAGAALLGHAAQRRLGVEAGGGDDHRGAVADAAEVAHHHAEAVVEGHRDAEPVLVGQVDQLGREVAVVEDVAVAEGGALGVAGRAGGVLDVDRLVRRQLPGEQLGQRHAGVRHVVVAPLGRPEEPDVLEGVEVAADLLDHGAVVAGLELRGRDQQPGAGLAKRVGQLVGAVRRVDVDQHRADLGGGQLGDRPLGAVRRPDAHPVALGDPGPQQPDGQRLDVAGQLGPAPAPAAGVLHQRLAVGVRRDRGVEALPDRLLEQRGLDLALGVRQRRLLSHGANVRRAGWRWVGSAA